MKIYYKAGLLELAKSSGYHGATLKALGLCSSFKRTHEFIMQVWEALYREMFHAFLQKNGNETVVRDVKCLLTAAVEQNHTPQQSMERIEALLHETYMHTGFKQFIEKMEGIDDTWKFWARFVFRDGYSYIGLYLAIRGSNWKLRLSSLKRMAPLFAAFDWDTYERIIPNHLADIKKYPTQILKCFEEGGFTVNINGERWRAVALDEAHEMCINKDLKAAVIRPTTSYLQKTTLFF